jgi:hypothetical protein
VRRNPSFGTAILLSNHVQSSDHRLRPAG